MDEDEDEDSDSSSESSHGSRTPLPNGGDSLHKKIKANGIEGARPDRDNNVTNCKRRKSWNDDEIEKLIGASKHSPLIPLDPSLVSDTLFDINFVLEKVGVSLSKLKILLKLSMAYL